MRQVVVVGAGIAGTALAACLAAVEGVGVTVLDGSPAGELRGSTGHAPGYVGLYVASEQSIGTELAVRSARVYEGLEAGGLRAFDRAGGLEVASSEAGMAVLTDRAAAARADGLTAHVVDAERAVALAPHLVDRESCMGAVHYPGDGTARAGVATAALRSRAEAAGARFLDAAPVTAVETRQGRHVVRAGADRHEADDVVIACGIWGPSIAAMAGERLPLTAVAHPYVHGPVTGSRSPTPFVRWPEHHVYARDHGDRFGLGTYDHVPLEVPQDELGATAEQPWPAELFDPAVDAALGLLPAPGRFAVAARLNGVFSMTADNLPLVGPLGGSGTVWAAEALWVTHAAGAAELLTRLMTEGDAGAAGMSALDPDRFDGRDDEDLAREALRLYRDIYATA